MEEVNDDVGKTANGPEGSVELLRSPLFLEWLATEVPRILVLRSVIEIEEEVHKRVRKKSLLVRRSHSS